MKIGIVTQPLKNNYGGLLQNYALQYVLKTMGHSVKTIDFVYYRPFSQYLLFVCKQIVKNLLKFKFSKIQSFKTFNATRNPLMSKFIDKYIEKTHVVRNYSKEIIYTEQFDVVLSGSDQVWRPRYNFYLEDMYLQFVPDNVKKIAYAASFGVDSWEYNEKLTQKCAILGKRLDAISVREESGLKFCQQYLGVTAEFVLDPTLLAGKEAFIPFLKEYKGDQFLFAYILDITSEKEEYVKKIAEEKGLEVALCSADQNATLSVEEWLSMIANSSMVVTDSFHGTVFSILFRREFFSIVNMQRGGARFESLLKPIGLESRMGDIAQINANTNLSIDWEQVEQNISEQRCLSMKFLTNALNK